MTVSSNTSAQLDAESRRILSSSWVFPDNRPIKELATLPAGYEREVSQRKLKARRGCEELKEQRYLASL